MTRIAQRTGFEAEVGEQWAVLGPRETDQSEQQEATWKRQWNRTVRKMTADAEGGRKARETPGATGQKGKKRESKAGRNKQLLPPILQCYNV